MRIQTAVRFSGLITSLVCLASFVQADEPLTLANVKKPTPNKADEKKAVKFSMGKAVRFLDQASLDWLKTKKCFTCHTNFAYLMARPADNSEAYRQVRASLEEMVEVRWEKEGPRWDAEVVMSAAVLAMSDADTAGKLHPTTKTALDRMWGIQKDDGGFNWLKCDWPPMESDDHFGATMALIGVGAAPSDYSDSPQAQEGIKKLKKYLANNPPPTLHHEAMVLWASHYVKGLVDPDEKKATIAALLKLQKPDGGWAVATLGNWERDDETPQDTTHSDGYGTGFVAYVLHLNGVGNDSPAIQQAVKWLKSNQRESGRWFTRSLFKDGNHFLSHAGTAFSVLALRHCDTVEAATKNDSAAE